MPYYYYFDRGRFDPADTMVREVGTTEAQQLVAERDYYTTIRTTWGSQDRGDDAGARTSVGKRREGCHDNTWCVLTTPYKDILVDLYHGGYEAPGAASWYSQ